MKSIIKLTLALLLACALQATGALAEAWPTKTVRIVVPQAPGGASDALRGSLASGSRSAGISR